MRIEKTRSSLVGTLQNARADTRLDRQDLPVTHDIHGNVWEWVQDSWHPAFYEESVHNGAIDPSRDFYGASNRVLRSGAWHDTGPRLCSSSRRLCHPPNLRLDHISFRVLLSTESFLMPRAPLAPTENTEQKVPNGVRNQSADGTDILQPHSTN